MPRMSFNWAVFIRDREEKPVLHRKRSQPLEKKGHVIGDTSSGETSFPWEGGGGRAHIAEGEGRKR